MILRKRAPGPNRTQSSLSGVNAKLPTTDNALGNSCKKSPNLHDFSALSVYWPNDREHGNGGGKTGVFASVPTPEQPHA
jgi:hypothetical protein